MDQFLFCISNKLVNNEISEGAIEFAYQGPLLQLVGNSALIAVSGKVNFNIIKKNGDIIKGIANESFLLYQMEIRLIFSQQLIQSMATYQLRVVLK